MKNRKNKILAAAVCGVIVSSIGTSIVLDLNSKDEDIKVNNEEENYLVEETLEEDIDTTEELEEIVEVAENIESEEIEANETTESISTQSEILENTSSQVQNNQSTSSNSTQNSTVQNSTQNSIQNNTQNNAVQKPVVEEDIKNDTIVQEPEVDNSESNSAKYSDGSYDGSGNGYGGNLQVKVQISDGKISNISLVSHNETPGFCEKAIEIISANIISAQSANVDTLSGATYTSNGIINAVKNALSKA